MMYLSKFLPVIAFWLAVTVAANVFDTENYAKADVIISDVVVV